MNFLPKPKNNQKKLPKKAFVHKICAFNVDEIDQRSKYFLAFAAITVSAILGSDYNKLDDLKNGKKLISIETLLREGKEKNR